MHERICINYIGPVEEIGVARRLLSEIVVGDPECQMIVEPQFSPEKNGTWSDPRPVGFNRRFSRIDQCTDENNHSGDRNNGGSQRNRVEPPCDANLSSPKQTFF